MSLRRFQERSSGVTGGSKNFRGTSRVLLRVPGTFQRYYRGFQGVQGAFQEAPEGFRGVSVNFSVFERRSRGVSGGFREVQLKRFEMT